MQRISAVELGQINQITGFLNVTEKTQDRSLYNNWNNLDYNKITRERKK